MKVEIPQRMYGISSLCPASLTQGNYVVWKNQFEGALKIHGLMDFISGTLHTPTVKLLDGSMNTAYELHMKNDSIVLS